MAKFKNKKLIKLNKSREKIPKWLEKLKEITQKLKFFLLGKREKLRKKFQKRRDK